MGVAVGLCLYLLPQARRHLLFSPPEPPPPTAVNHTDHARPSVSIQPPQSAQLAEEHPKNNRQELKLTAKDSQTAPEPARENSDVPTAHGSAVVSVSEVSPSPPPAPLTFKPLGYVEKAGGQLEAIILQENEVQVVHIGDLVSGRYQITKITPDSVEAVDETTVQSPVGRTDSRELTADADPLPAKPPKAATQGSPVPAVAGAAAQGQQAEALPQGGVAPLGRAVIARPEQKPLGYVEQTDGLVQTVVAEADTVRLVPGPSTATLAEAAPSVYPAMTSVAQNSPTQPMLPDGAGNSPSNEGHASPSQGVGGIREAAYEVQDANPAPADGSAARLEATLTGQMAGASSSPGDSASQASEIGFPAPAGDSSGSSVYMEPLGFVVKPGGEFADIVKYRDEIYVVGEGERFAGRFRALSVTADRVEAEIDPPRDAHPPPLRAPPETPVMLTAAARDGPEFFSMDDCIKCEFHAPGEVSSKSDAEASFEPGIPPGSGKIDPPGRIIPVAAPRQSPQPASRQADPPPETGTYVFQTLGYVKTQDGDTRAIVADESDLYLVKQGETFAGRYLAVSIDSALVLARRISPIGCEGNTLSAQAESASKDGSKNIDGNWHFPLSELTSLQSLQSASALGNTSPAGPGHDALNFSLAGSGLESPFFMAGNLSF